MKKNIIYAMGQRIAKTVTNKNTTDGTDKFVTTYYVRDPQGNVLAVYEHKHGDSGNGTFTLTEQHLYGAGRLGMKKRDLALNVANASESTPPATHYELTNHLGNVMAVISDKASDTNEPTVVSLSDYYPFGMTEPGRSYRVGDYRYGFNGKEIEEEGIYNFGERLYDSRLCRWMRIDNYHDKYPNISPYSFALCSPNQFIDSEGNFVEDKEGHIIFTIDKDNPTGYQTNNYNQHFEVTVGYVLTNDGVKVSAYITTDNIVCSSYINQESEIVYVPLPDDQQSEFDVEYNCTGNAMGKKVLVISSFDITPEILEGDGYSSFRKVKNARKGDIVVYIGERLDPATGKMRRGIVHFEYFEEEGKVSTKGGTAPRDKELSEPGQNELYKDCDVKYYHYNGPVKKDLNGKNNEIRKNKIIIIPNEDFDAIQQELIDAKEKREAEDKAFFEQHNNVQHPIPTGPTR